MRSRGKTVTLSATVLAAAGLTACGVVDHDPDLIAGKRAFVQKCGSCHQLDRAGTKGNQGPNLDQAFQQSLSDGIKRSTLEGVVHRQILYPNRRAQQDPTTQKLLIAMPAKLVKGDLANDVSAYVASVASKSGKDGGRLADIGSAQAKGTAKAKNGSVEIDADPTGQLAFQVASASAPAGSLDIKMVNKSQTGHNIAIKGQGVDQKGQIVKGGGTSQVKADLKPGKYVFYCSVPGHEQAGMKGELTVK
jgi:plastocyanin